MLLKFNIIRKYALTGFILIGLIFFISCEPDSFREKEKEAEDLISTALNDSIFAGAVILVGSSDEILYSRAFGYAHLYNEDLSEVETPIIMTEDHLFDLASLTKVLATTYGLMVLHSRGEISTDDFVSKYLPEFDSDEKKSITIEHLLRHTSGILPWYPSYYVATTPEERLQFTANELLINTPGEDRLYSDFGFMVLGDIIENVSGQTLDQFLITEVYDPLGLNSTFFNPDSELHNQIVSTSHGNPFEKKMVYDDNFGFEIDIDPTLWNDWRTYTLNGEVNDGNAFYTHQGIAGHAGLFSTASEIYVLLSVLLKDGKFNEKEIINPATINHFLDEDSFGHGMGWMKTDGSLHSNNLPENSFGHTGFTGTNIVISPETDRILIFLTNRQHMGVDSSGNYPNLRPVREELSKIFFSD